ncbi:MAG: DNA polymerase ligase N-terminal domain-containing protein [Actinopolymorphaceae bacterium]
MNGPRDRVNAPRFVVQRHHARTLHYDFRLEVDGVLASWAVPKGPSLDPRQKRLAAQVEDHSLDHIDYEGRLAPGEYGAGTVIVWDTGTYENLTERRGEPVPMAQGLENGHVKFRLHGEKLRGAFALTRTRFRGRDDQWLLVKVDDEDADRRRTPERTELRSVLSGRTNEDLSEE